MQYVEHNLSIIGNLLSKSKLFKHYITFYFVCGHIIIKFEHILDEYEVTNRAKFFLT